MSVTTPTAPVRAVPEDFAARIEAALARRPEVEAHVERAVAAGVDNIFLVGCGGSLFGFGPLRVLLDRSPIPCFTVNADELLTRRPAALGARSLVVISSTNGGTAETARAAELATQVGAQILGITQDPASVVGQACPELVLHQGIEAKQVVLALLGWSLLDALGAAPEHAEAMTALQASPAAFRTAIDEMDADLDRVAAALHAEPVVYVVGSGPLESAADTLAMCYLQEMQWKHAVAVGSGEFLHGPFEMVTEDLPVIVLTGEDTTRPMGERVIRFLERYSDKVHVVDGARLTLPGVPEAMRPFVGTLVMASTIVGRLAEHFEAWSGHALSERRYMWKVDY
ncbi:hypothetical protein BJF86_04945 [Serinicoccus sp. CNJ-927]|uniref:SIS domain-containing protein n=1 Tax=Serinicoccus sp. CNJ-927 TaxID=1904970 RepID=UPI00096016BA|nr:SIS domain-containing protein [Serinicoccus sp. CNJ-927]OLT40161.1 hypothetical protein BJF86_04945 [Serinicoccus sp. CNJ-927]